ncbi:MAG: hypothetical protein OEY44_03995 [Candidatus Peregrinibacteria bacterium]|nr:hypothetical protein [Candidatus Peregrinibacteria bacterium]
MDNIFKTQLRRTGRELAEVADQDVADRDQLMRQAVHLCRMRIKQVGERAWPEITEVLYGAFTDGQRFDVFNAIGLVEPSGEIEHSPQSGVATNPAPAMQDRISTLAPVSKSSGVEEKGDQSQESIAPVSKSSGVEERGDQSQESLSLEDLYEQILGEGARGK